MGTELQLEAFLGHGAKRKAVVRVPSLSASNGERAGVRCRSLLPQDGVRVWLDEEQLPSPAGAGDFLRPSDGRRWRSRMRADAWPGEGPGAEPDRIPAKISQDPDIAHALFAVLETQNIIAGEANITLIPRNSELLGQMVAATQSPKGERVK